MDLERPVLIGHSAGGQDLHTIGAQHADRVAGLMYLDSAEDATLTAADYGVDPPNPEDLPTRIRPDPPPDYSSFAAYRVWQRQTQGVAFPESELRQVFAANVDGSMGRSLMDPRVRDAIFEGRPKPDYARIQQVPVLAFFVRRPLEEQVARYEISNAAERAALAQQHAFARAGRTVHIRALRRGVPSARVVEVEAPNLYFFLSNVPEIVRELRTFMADLP